MSTRFVAIPVAPVVRERLDVAIAAVRGRRSELAWTDPLGWHVTLAFLGRLPDTAVQGIAEVVGAALAEVEGHGSDGVGASRRLTVARAAAFGTRVLVVEIADDPTGHVAALGARIQSGLAEAGLPVHERPVRAHLTLARGRRGAAVDPPLVAETQRAIDGLPDVIVWQPRSVGVYASHPRSNGPARYVMDAEVPLTR